MLSRIFRSDVDNVVKRKRQIDTLKVFNDNVLELQEDVEYQVHFDAGDKRMAIQVSLSPNFPLEKPVLRVSPPIRHKWCNEHSEIVQFPGLLSFTINSDLGRVVQAIIREFSKNPPQLVDETSPVCNLALSDLTGRTSPATYVWKPHELASGTYNPYYVTPFQQFSSSNVTPSIFNYNYTNAGNTYIGNSLNSVQQYNPTTNAPPVQYSSSPSANTYTNLHYVNANVGPAMQNQVQQIPVQQMQYSKPKKVTFKEFPELDNMMNEELKKLAEDEDLMDDFLEKHPKIREIDSAVEDAIDWVERTATENVTKEEELEELRKDITEKKEKLESVRSNYEDLIEQYNKLSEVFKPEHIRDELSKAADDSQEQSELIAQDFLNSKIDVERFLSTYIECRKLGQARRTKEEKLAHQLNELKRAVKSTDELYK